MGSWLLIVATRKRSGMRRDNETSMVLVQNQDRYQELQSYWIACFSLNASGLLLCSWLIFIYEAV